MNTNQDLAIQKSSRFFRKMLCPVFKGSCVQRWIKGPRIQMLKIILIKANLHDLFLSVSMRCFEVSRFYTELLANLKDLWLLNSPQMHSLSSQTLFIMHECVSGGDASGRGIQSIETIYAHSLHLTWFSHSKVPFFGFSSSLFVH